MGPTGRASSMRLARAWQNGLAEGQDIVPGFAQGSSGQVAEDHEILKMEPIH